MHFFILGASGLVGKNLTYYLIEKGHHLELLLRKESQEQNFPKDCQVVIGNPLKSGQWQEQAAQADVLVNLVGKNIMTRWTAQEKEAILSTRIQSTNNAVQALANNPANNSVLINANAVGYYSSRSQDIATENSPPGNNFLSKVCKSWQEEAQKAEDYGARVVISRFAPVLAPKGGLMDSILPIFRLGLGGRLGKGRQPFPWVHIQDLVRAIEYSALNDQIKGPVNMCAPQVINNSQFTKALSKALRRPALLPVPETALKLMFGEMSQMLLESPKVKPELLEKTGFQFQFADIESALYNLFRTS